MAKGELQIRKQQLVRDAIHAAAMELFAEKGFDATTVEEVALLAGVSRRSFFRYFVTKDDLLGQSIGNYGAVLTTAIRSCAAKERIGAVVRETVFAGVRHTAAQEQLVRQTIAISQRSLSARKAYASRMVEVEDSISEAYAERFENASKNALVSRLLAHMTISVMSVAITAWFTGEYKDLMESADAVLRSLADVAKELPAEI